MSFLIDRRCLDARDKFGATAEENARTEETRRLLFATRAIRTVVLRVHGFTYVDAFLDGRDVVPTRAWRARDAKGTDGARCLRSATIPREACIGSGANGRLEVDDAVARVGDAIAADVEALATNPGTAGRSYARVAELVAEAEIRVERQQVPARGRRRRRGVRGHRRVASTCS